MSYLLSTEIDAMAMRGITEFNQMEVLPSTQQWGVVQYKIRKLILSNGRFYRFCLVRASEPGLMLLDFGASTPWRITETNEISPMSGFIPSFYYTWRLKFTNGDFVVTIPKNFWEYFSKIMKETYVLIGRPRPINYERAWMGGTGSV